MVKTTEKRREMGKMKQLKKESAVTLIALVVTIVILIILAAVSINMVLGDQGIFKKAQEGANSMHDAEVNTQMAFNSITDEMDKIIAGNSIQNPELRQDTPNAPEQIDGMTPIKFTEPTETEMGSVEETTWDDNSWYNYNQSKWANTKSEDGSMWVWIPRYAYKITYTNPENKSEGGTIEVRFLEGTSDNYYENGELKTAKRQTSPDETVDTTTDFYVHPAFTNETSINFANGGWDSELTGMYVAKFEAGFPEGNNTTPSKKSSVSYTQDTSYVRAIEAGTSGDSREQLARNWLDGIYGETETKISYPVFQPLTYSMNYINENDAYNISKAMNENGNIYGFTTSSSDTHLMKNSEWGMISYLSYSQYGTNGQDIAINNANLNSGGATRTNTTGKSGVDSVYGITGMTQGLADGAETVVKIDEIKALSGNTPTPTGSIYAWNQQGGIIASSTRNITGVYDLSGGTWDRIATYVANGNDGLLIYGASVAYIDNVLKTASTKYTMVYPHDSSVDNNNQTDWEAANIANYAKNTKIYGDAIRETSISGIGTNAWGSDKSIFISINAPFMLRGGTFSGNSSAGRVSSDRTIGDSAFDVGFRPVVIPILNT